jgi:hypothetical protein
MSVLAHLSMAQAWRGCLEYQAFSMVLKMAKTIGLKVAVDIRMPVSFHSLLGHKSLLYTWSWELFDAKH